MDRGSPEPGGWGGVACQHLGKRVWLRLYVCVCECASVCVSVCVCHTDTILSTLAERGDTNGGGKKETFALMHFKTDGQEHLQL